MTPGRGTWLLAQENIRVTKRISYLAFLVIANGFSLWRTWKDESETWRDTLLLKKPRDWGMFVCCHILCLFCSPILRSRCIIIHQCISYGKSKKTTETAAIRWWHESLARNPLCSKEEQLFVLPLHEMLHLPPLYCIRLRLGFIQLAPRMIKVTQNVGVPDITWRGSRTSKQVL